MVSFPILPIFDFKVCDSIDGLSNLFYFKIFSDLFLFTKQMATFSGLAPVRDDFRCSLCRQKNAFHCEHDTPYRDQLLGSYDQEKPHMGSKNSRSDPHRKHSSNNHYNDSTSNNKMQHINIGQNVNPNTDPRYQQSRKIENSPSTTPYSYDHTRINEKKTKNKSCVIL